MAVGKPDEYQHNNEDLAYVDSNFVRGGRRVVATRSALYALARKADQLRAYVTEVYVVAENVSLRLVDLAQVGNAAGWVPVGGASTFADLGGDPRDNTALAEALDNLPAGYTDAQALTAVGPYLGAPQWAAGQQYAGRLVYDQGGLYRVKNNLANSQSAPAGNPANYLFLGPGPTYKADNDSLILDPLTNTFSANDYRLVFSRAGLRKTTGGVDGRINPATGILEANAAWVTYENVQVNPGTYLISDNAWIYSLYTDQYGQKYGTYGNAGNDNRLSLVPTEPGGARMYLTISQLKSETALPFIKPRPTVVRSAGPGLIGNVVINSDLSMTAPAGDGTSTPPATSDPTVAQRLGKTTPGDPAAPTSLVVNRSPALAPLLAALQKSKTQAVNLVFLGTSTIFGVGASTGDKNLVSVFAKKLQAAYPSGSGSESGIWFDPQQNFGAQGGTGLKIYNGGSNQGPNADQLLLNVAAIGQRNPALVWFQNLTVDWFNGVAPATAKAAMVANIEHILAARTAATPCTFVLSLPFGRFDQPPTGPYQLSEFAEICAQIARERTDTVALILTQDFAAVGLPGNDPLGLGDGGHIHLSDAGHAFSAELWYRGLGLPPAASVAAVATGPAPGGIDYANPVTVSGSATLAVNAAYLLTGSGYPVYLANPANNLGATIFVRVPSNASGAYSIAGTEYVLVTTENALLLATPDGWVRTSGRSLMLRARIETTDTQNDLLPAGANNLIPFTHPLYASFPSCVNIGTASVNIIRTATVTVDWGAVIYNMTSTGYALQCWFYQAATNTARAVKNNYMTEARGAATGAGSYTENVRPGDYFFLRVFGGPNGAANIIPAPAPDNCFISYTEIQPCP